MTGRGRTAALLLACALGLARPAHAADAIPSDAVYSIVHEEHGEIGVHKVDFEKNGEDLIVKVTGEASVSVAFITVFRFTTSRRETWRDGRLVGYLAETDDDGTDSRVQIGSEGDLLRIATRGAAATAPGDLMLGHPWNLAVTEQNRLIDSESGALLKVAITRAGEDTIQIAGKPIKATKYVVTGDQNREIWYGPDGTWLQLRLRSRGALVTMTRQ